MNQLAAVKDFDATKLSAKEVVELLLLSGYTEGTEVSTLEHAEKLGYFAYAGYTNTKSHRYVFAWFDDEDSEKWQVVDVYIDIGKGGKVQCEYGGMPIHEFDEEDEIDKYFKRVRREHKA